jgi:type IV pilus assembly protein PilE
MNRKQQGFTLIEIMVTVVIVAILAAIALPQYGQYVTRSSLVEAHAGLPGFRVLMEQYYQDNRTYAGTGTGGCGLPAMTPVYKNFGHGCAVGVGGQTYTATATGNTGSRVEGFAFSINQANQRVTTAAPSGWVAAANCFTTRKDGEC